MLQNPQTCFLKLLVAQHVMLYWPVLLKVRPIPSYQGTVSPPSWRTAALPIPEECWDAISIDFIAELPKFGSYNAIMVVVDSVSKWAHFVEVVTTKMAAGSANLYLRHVWKLHGLP